VFNTFVNQALLKAERGDEVEFAYGFARAHNRAMLDFCAVDRRLLATCYVPLRDAEGGSHFVKVRDPAVLDRVKAGDPVVVTLTEALRIEVVAP